MLCQIRNVNKKIQKILFFNFHWLINFIFIAYLPLISTHQFFFYKLYCTWCYITRLSQKFCNILEMCGTIQQFRILLMRLWSWQTTLDCEMSNTTDIPKVPLGAQPQNLWFEDYLTLQDSCNLSKVFWTVIVLCLAVPFVKQIFWVASVILWLSLNL